jgi:beta-N-acetylhexosaminidase
MTAHLRHAAGSLLVVGLSGAELTDLERAWLKLLRPAGIILFRRNIQDAKQTRSLLAESTSLCAPAAFRCVDVEGGSVDRLRDALEPIPSAQSVAMAAASAPALPQEHGDLVGHAVSAFGFNTTLAPVLDLALPASASVLGTRTAGATPATVIEYARGFLAGLKAHGVAGCGKHFPGLGGGTLDSHLDTPSIRRTTRELWHQDLLPYRELRTQLPMIMVSHAEYPETPSKLRPASVSRYWIDYILRKRIGYRGIIFSDDLEMGGILKFATIEEAAVESVIAGMDLLEICHSPELILRAYEALIGEAERSTAFARLLHSRAASAATKRAELFHGEQSAALSAKQLDALRSRILRFGEKVSGAQSATEGLPA